MEVKLLEITPLPSGNVRTLWRLADGAKRQIVIHAGAYDEAGIAQIKRALERSAPPRRRAGRPAARK